MYCEIRELICFGINCFVLGLSVCNLIYIEMDYRAKKKAVERLIGDSKKGDN